MFALAEALEKNGDSTLANAIKKYIETAPDSVKNKVQERYGDASDREILEEVFAFGFSEGSAEKVREFIRSRGYEDPIETAESIAWYQSIWNAIKDLWEKVKQFFGSKYADLSVFEGYEQMSHEEIGDALADLLLGGKKIKTTNNAIQEKEKDSEDRKRARLERDYPLGRDNGARVDRGLQGRREQILGEKRDLEVYGASMDLVAFGGTSHDTETSAQSVGDAIVANAKSAGKYIPKELHGDFGNKLQDKGRESVVYANKENKSVTGKKSDFFSKFAVRKSQQYDRRKN